MKQFTLWCALACAANAATAQNRTPSANGADTLRLSRRQAIATALIANPQLDIAREQTAQVRAQRVENNGLNNPTIAYSYDGQTDFLQLGTAAAHNLNVGLGIPYLISSDSETPSASRTFGRQRHSSGSPSNSSPRRQDAPTTLCSSPDYTVATSRNRARLRSSSSKKHKRVLTPAPWHAST